MVFVERGNSSDPHGGWPLVRAGGGHRLSRTPCRLLPELPMPLAIRTDACVLDFLSLGALVHRLDPGVIPFRKARTLDIHVSGGEYNVAANLADCFGMKTGVCTAMVNYPIGDLVQARVREMGVLPFYKHFEH